jgi:hypothetical protein
VNGIPDLLFDHQGDFTMVYHGGSLAPGAISFLLTLVPTFGAIAGWVIKIHNRNYETVLGRISGHFLSNNVLTSSNQFTLSDLHTISFTYEENYTATDSRLKVYWDGLFLGSVENPYSPIRWNTGAQLYLGRFVNQEVNGVSYVGGFKIFKRVLSPLKKCWSNTWTSLHIYQNLKKTRLHQAHNARESVVVRSVNPW